MKSELDENKKEKLAADKIFLIAAFVGFSIWLVLDTIRVLLYSREEISGNLQFWAGYGLSIIVYYVILAILTFFLKKNSKGKVVLNIIISVLTVVYFVGEIIRILQPNYFSSVFLIFINVIYLISLILASISFTLTTLDLMKGKK